MAIIGSSAQKWNPEKFKKNQSFMDGLLSRLKADE